MWRMKLKGIAETMNENRRNKRNKEIKWLRSESDSSKTRNSKEEKWKMDL